MRAIKKAVLGLFITASIMGFCEEKPAAEIQDSYNYWGIGAGIPTFVSVNFGHRKQWNHRGFECGVGVTPLIYVTEGHVFSSFLYFLNPSPISQTYLGLGLRAGGFLELNRIKFGYVAPWFHGGS